MPGTKGSWGGGWNFSPFIISFKSPNRYVIGETNKQTCVMSSHKKKTKLDISSLPFG